MINKIYEFLTKYANKSLDIKILSNEGFKNSYIIKKFFLYSCNESTINVADNKYNQEISFNGDNIKNVTQVNKFEMLIEYHAGTKITLKLVNKRVRDKEERFTEVNNGLHVDIYQDEWGNIKGQIVDNP